MNEDFKLIKRFLTLSIFSAVGNSCADWALFFYALKKVNLESHSGLSKASLFYIGYGVGRMILAPILGVLFDRFSKKHLSIFVDSAYALLLFIAAILFGIEKLDDMAFLVITVLIHTFSQIHMQSVGFAAVKKHAPQHGGRYLALMFALSTGIGVATSGIFFSLIGFYGCMAFAILTFVPVILLYPKLFEEEKSNERLQKSNYFSDFLESFQFLFKDKILLKFGLILGLFNTVGALFPAYLKLEVNQSIEGTDFYTAPILASGLIIMTLFYKRMDLGSDKLRGSQAFALAFAPILISSIVAYFFPSIWTLSLLYLSACFGSGLRNIITANLRTKRVPKEKISRVNTVYGALLNIGPLLGGIFVIPALELNIKQGLIIAIVITGLSIALSLLYLPKDRISEFSREVV